jgi:heptosyltransferase-3
VRILVYRLGSLGDTVVALPCFRRIRNAYPQAKITVLTNLPVSGKAAPLETVLENTGLIDDVIPYPLGLRDLRAIADLRRKIAGERFDLAISLAAARGLSASIRDYLFFRFCGIPKIIGIPWRRRDLTCRPYEGAYENEGDRLLRRVASIPRFGPEDRGLGLTEAEAAEAQRLLRESKIHPPFIAASVGTKLPIKDWGVENWEKFLASLSRDCPVYGLVLLGSADERERSAELARAWTGAVANLCGETSPRVSAAVLREARLFVGHDSGPMHLAAAVGTRCVAVYSAQSRPGQWFPRGTGHHNLYPDSFFDPRRMEDFDYQRRAIASISVQTVLEAVKSCLSSPGLDKIEPA